MQTEITLGRTWIGHCSVICEASQYAAFLMLIREAKSCSVRQEFPSLLWNPKVHYRVHKSSLLYPILSQMNQVYILKSYFPPINKKQILNNNALKLSVPFIFSHALVLNSTWIGVISVRNYPLAGRRRASDLRLCSFYAAGNQLHGLMVLKD
jgi:hypothetical protein